MKKIIEKLNQVALFVWMRASYFAIVGGAIAVCAVYLYLIQVDRYVSHVRIRVESEGTATLPSVELGLVSLGASTSSVLDAQLLLNYIESPAMLEELDRDLNLRGHYSQSWIDPLSRMAEDDSREKFLNYYLSRVTVDIDDKAQLLLIDVQGFDPDFSKKTADAIVRHAEDFVNELNHSLAREQIAFVQSQVEESSRRLQAATIRLEEFQARNLISNPQEESRVSSAIIAGLKQEISTEQAKLSALSAYLSPNAPDIRASRQRIDALEEQLELERKRQVGGEGQGINRLQLEFREAQTEAVLADELYRSNLTSLEGVKTSAIKKVKHLVRVSGPTLPDSSELPKRGFSMITFVVVFNILYLIGKLIVATVRDHQD